MGDTAKLHTDGWLTHHAQWKELERYFKPSRAFFGLGSELVFHRCPFCHVKLQRTKKYLIQRCTICGRIEEKEFYGLIYGRCTCCERILLLKDTQNPVPR